MGPGKSLVVHGDLRHYEPISVDKEKSVTEDFAEVFWRENEVIKDSFTLMPFFCFY